MELNFCGHDFNEQIRAAALRTVRAAIQECVASLPIPDISEYIDIQTANDIATGQLHVNLEVLCEKIPPSLDDVLDPIFPGLKQWRKNEAAIQVYIEGKEIP